MAKWFCGSGFALPTNAARCFSCALVVIAGNAIAACRAGNWLGYDSAVRPIAAISRAPKDASTTATGSGSTASVAAGRA
jgi:hypothetical protein